MVEEDEFVQRAESRVGRKVNGRWTLDALLGVGGMASVYAATNEVGQRVAVKWLHPELLGHENVRQRFVREGYIANRVNHPGVARVLEDDVTDDGSPVIIMELLDGETVDARWERSGKHLDVFEALRIAKAVLEVIAVAHDAGVVHRDLKPENLFLTRADGVKVLDFGIARLRELNARTGMTGSQSSFGTPGFMAPEQARGRWEEVDARTDLWAIGATLFTLIAGRHVHEAETVNEVLLAAMTQPAPPLASVAPSAPPAVCHLVDRALAFRSEDRWPNARAMLEACVTAQQAPDGRSDRIIIHVSPQGPFLAAPAVDGSSSRRQSGRTTAAVVAAMVAVGVIAVGGGALLRRSAAATTAHSAVTTGSVAAPPSTPPPLASTPPVVAGGPELDPIPPTDVSPPPVPVVPSVSTAARPQGKPSTPRAVETAPTPTPPTSASATNGDWRNRRR